MDRESTNSIKHLLVSRFCRLEIELHRPRLSKLNNVFDYIDVMSAETGMSSDLERNTEV